MRNNLLALLVFLSSSSFCYAEILDQFKDRKDDSPLIIDAEESIVCDETVGKCVATKNATAQKGDKIVYGDVLTAYFTNERKITAVTADGNVRMKTPTDEATGEHAHYDLALDRVILTGGNLKVTTPNEILTANDSIEYWHKEDKGIARGNAIATFPAKGELIQAETLTAYFKKSPDEKAEGKEKNSIDRIEAVEHVLASGPKGVVTGDRGTYSSTKNLVEVFDNVKLTQDKNIIEGQYARYNMKTDLAEVFAQLPDQQTSKPKKRISGIIYSKDAKKMREDRQSLTGTKKPKDQDRQAFPSSAKTREQN